MTAGKYVIRGGTEGRERLRLLSEVMGPSTLALLAEVGVPRGAVCLDLGCGGGDVTRELARLAGPEGRAIGVDLDAVKVDIARKESEDLGISNVAFEARDVTRWAPGETFDVVYARFLLTHLRQPAALLSAVKPRVRKGGAVILEDIDFRGHFAEPPCPAMDRYVALYSRCVRARGADPDIGPRLPGLLREAGFDDVRMRLVHPAALEGGVKLLTCVTLESIADAVVEERLASEDEIHGTLEELYAFARDPHTVLGGPRVFEAWGRAG
jgi:SAM-dependent methyltransferase